MNQSRNVQRTLRVLLAEDDRDTAATQSELLRMYGHAVEVAYDGPAALESARARQPDVVLLDIGLPKTDGLEVARQLCADSATRAKRPFLVAITGHASIAAQRRGLEAGIDLYVVKPVDPVELEVVLRRFKNALGLP